MLYTQLSWLWPNETLPLIRFNAILVYWGGGLEGDRSGTMGGRSLGCFFGFYLREAFQGETSTKKILYNESH